ncbi:uncharacterized protein LOC118803724 [Colossoma macropomum]|uniref:uncharacterized protein LOC118803724 n=1 Tax=Colossoma macropomum TaxID=42526 RepID=UPI001864D990|nr:uncharacterized protein LOC118803724 [Colossoma macropomum]
MQSSCSALCVLILLVTTFTAAVPPVKVKLHDSATLPCSKRCSGSAKWTLFDKSSGTLAECDQTSCRSVKEGYQMTLAAYRAGDLSLIITDADFTKSNTYACDCDGKDLCDVTLQVEHSESTIPSVKVNLHDSANLSCSERCSGLARWTKYHKPTDALAECNQTDCRSVKEGYQMIHDRLTITDADFTKRGWYTCLCDGTYLCDVALRIEALNTPRQIKAGESVFLDLDISDPVEVIYSSTGSSSGQICTVDGHSLQCKPEYKQRASVQTVLELKEIKPSDSGDYTIRDFRNKEDIHIYTVTISDGEPLPRWAIALIAVVAVVAFLAVGILICFLRNKKIREVLKTESIFYWKPEQNSPSETGSLNVEAPSPDVGDHDDGLIHNLIGDIEEILTQNPPNLGEQISDRISRIEGILTDDPGPLQNPDVLIARMSDIIERLDPIPNYSDLVTHLQIIINIIRDPMRQTTENPEPVRIQSTIIRSPEAVQNSRTITYDPRTESVAQGDPQETTPLNKGSQNTELQNLH